MTKLSQGLKPAYLLLKTLSAMIAGLWRGWKHGKNTTSRTHPHKILLFGYMGLGDALMFQPSLKAILSQYPDSTIDLIIGKESQSKAILERSMWMMDRQFGRVLQTDYKSLSIRELRALNSQLVSEHYDIVICTYMSPTPYFTSAIMSAPVRVGHSLPWDKWYKPRPNPIFNIRVRLAQDHEHETSRHRRLIDALIMEEVPYEQPHIKLTDQESKLAEAFWDKHDLEGRMVIGTHFGASRTQHWKKWDDDQFAIVLRMIADEFNPIFLHFGTDNERDQIDEASKSVRERSINLAGQLAIFDVAALLSKCNAMLANDSGLGHVAMAVGTRTVRVFGVSDYWGYRSLSEQHTDVFKGVSCSPCLQLGYLKPYNVHNCGHKNCMKLITPDEVAEAFKRIASPLP